MKRVALLGATGSIGRQAIEIVEAHPELELCAVASGSTPLDDVDAPLKQVGGDLTELLDRAEPDVVLNAVVGFAGIHATLWALERGVDLALANKESLVAAGPLALAAQERGGGRILPVDSEHSALFQCLEGRSAEQIDTLVLTGSGGPFRGRTRAELEDVTPEQALAHPTWRMGPKITIDSATLANKGLELIEAHFLFGVPYDRIEVVIQPTSIVHSLVRFRDGAALAHLGYPDMRVPISYALTYPERAATPLAPLDFTSLTLEFSAPDTETFPMLALAREAGEKGGAAPCVYNAANEVAVAAFLAGRLPFLAIPEVVAETLAEASDEPVRDLDDLRRDRSRRTRNRGRSTRGRMNLVIAVASLVGIVLIHELGHFWVALAVGMRPRSLNVGFGPPLVKTERRGIVYALRALPLGGYVRLPGMTRPSARDVEVWMSRPVEEAPSLAPAALAVRRALGAADYGAARAAYAELEEAVAAANLSPTARRSAERVLRDVEEGTAPDAYWRAPTWKRISVILAGPLANVLSAFVILVLVFTVSGVADSHGHAIVARGRGGDAGRARRPARRRPHRRRRRQARDAPSTPSLATSVRVTGRRSR